MGEIAVLQNRNNIFSTSLVSEVLMLHQVQRLSTENKQTKKTWERAERIEEETPQSPP